MHSRRTCTSEKVRGSQSLFPEKGISCEGVEHVVGFPLRGFGQCKHLLLRHTGGDGDVPLVQRMEALLEMQNATGVTGAWEVVTGTMEKEMH